MRQAPYANNSRIPVCVFVCCCSLPGVHHHCPTPYQECFITVKRWFPCLMCRKSPSRCCLLISISAHTHTHTSKRPRVGSTVWSFNISWQSTARLIWAVMGARLRAASDSQSVQHHGAVHSAEWRSPAPFTEALANPRWPPFTQPAAETQAQASSEKSNQAICLLIQTQCVACTGAGPSLEKVARI